MKTIFILYIVYIVIISIFINRHLYSNQFDGDIGNRLKNLDYLYLL